MTNKANTKRTLKLISLDIEKAVQEVSRLISIKYEEFQELRKINNKEAEEQRENVNYLGTSRIESFKKYMDDNPKDRGILSKMRVTHENKIKALDFKHSRERIKLRDAYVKDCETAINQTATKYDLRVKTITRILGR